MRIVVLCLVAGCLCLCSSGAHAAAYEQLLTTPVGIRSRGMMGIGVALPGPSFALDANPALLVNQPDSQVLAAGAIWNSRVSDYLLPIANTGAGKLLQSGTLLAVHGSARLDRLHWPLVVAVSYRRCNANQYVYSWPSYSGWQDAVTVGMAYRATRHLAVGYLVRRLNDRLRRRYSIYDDTYQPAWSHDVGLYLTRLFPWTTIWASSRPGDETGINVGLALRNLGSDVGLGQPWARELPRTLAFGFGWQVSNTENVSLLLTAEAQRDIAGIENSTEEILKATGQMIVDGLALHSRRSDWVGVGIECHINRQFGLRGGVATDEDGRPRRFSFGTGVTTRLLTFLYARTLPAVLHGGTDAFAVTLHW